MPNTVTSRTSSVDALVVTQKIPAFAKGCVAYLKYTKGNGTKVGIKFAFIAPDLDASDLYEQLFINPTTGAVVVQNFEFTAAGNYRVPLPMCIGERTVKATVTFTDGDTQALVLDFRED